MKLGLGLGLGLGFGFGLGFGVGVGLGLGLRLGLATAQYLGDWRVFCTQLLPHLALLVRCGASGPPLPSRRGLHGVPEDVLRQLGRQVETTLRALQWALP